MQMIFGGIMKKFTWVLFLFFSFIISSDISAAQKIIDYGFEVQDGWDGLVGSAQGYPVTSSALSYWSDHENSTDIVSSYYANEMGQTWLPHSGSNFFIQNDSDSFQMDPSVPGISQGTVNGRNIIGGTFPYGGEDKTSINAEITTGEIFVRFWARQNRGWSTIADGGKNKWIRFYTPGHVVGDTIYMHLGTDSISPEMYFYCSGEPGPWIPSESGPSLTNAYDGNWHKYSMYVNWNTGTILAWYDVDNETTENATKTYQAADGSLGSSPASNPDYVIIKSNYSAKAPTEETYHAIDDIEIWDGMPTANPCVDEPAGPPGDVTNESASYLTQNNLVYINATWSNPSDADFKGTMVRYNISGNENYPQVHTEGTLGADVVGGTEGTFNITSPGIYWISYFTYDDCGNYSQTAYASLDVPANIFPDSSPVITITQPTSGNSYISSGSSINISGTASDDRGITSVSWQNDRGGSGSASGTTSWSVANITLADGINVITVTITDTNSQVSTDIITVNFTAGVVQAWGAEEQTGQTGWSDSSATWCVRVPLNGSSVMTSGNQVKISFKGRTSGDYTVKKASIAERDINGGVGAVVDSTWTKVTFNGYPVDTWSANGALVPVGGEKISDPVNFDIQPGTEYYVTFMLESPSAYLSPSTDQSEIGRASCRERV